MPADIRPESRLSPYRLITRNRRTRLTRPVVRVFPDRANPVRRISDRSNGRVITQNFGRLYRGNRSWLFLKYY